MTKREELIRRLHKVAAVLNNRIVFSEAHQAVLDAIAALTAQPTGIKSLAESADTVLPDFDSLAQPQPQQEPYGYVWEMKDGSRQTMWSPIDPENAFYSEPAFGSFNKFVTLYPAPQPGVRDALTDLVADIENGYGDPHTLRHAKEAITRAAEQINAEGRETSRGSVAKGFDAGMGDSPAPSAPHAEQTHIVASPDEASAIRDWNDRKRANAEPTHVRVPVDEMQRLVMWAGTDQHMPNDLLRPLKAMLRAATGKEEGK